MTKTFSRRALVGLLVLLPTAVMAQRVAAPGLSADDQVLATRAVVYLQGLTAAQGRFVQTDARGRTSSGDFYLQRPGKVRFAYDPPNDMLVVSDGNQISIHDKRLKTFDRYALRMTPLSLFLAREIRLDRGVKVTNVSRYADGFSITASDVKKETAGQIILTFADAPIRLKEWTVIDAQGQRTRVALSDLQPAPNLDPKLFVLRDPRPRMTAR